MKILLLSAYDAASHRYWREGLVSQFPEYNWTVLTLPDRHFSWRIRGNSLTWAFTERKALEAGYDLAIATSMTDLSALRGMVPKLTQIPTLVYFHENQFEYPLSQHQKESQIFARTLNLYTALAADKVVFNTQYNRHTYFSGVSGFLNLMPDGIPVDVIPELARKSSVLPVPLRNECLYERRHPQRQRRPEILWNHRWEYDKAPDRFFLALTKLKDSGSDFKLHVIGQQFRRWPRCFDVAKQTFAEKILSWGFVERDRYLAILKRADIVVSTALHDFQGVALLEAVACGCIPLAPNRLAYPEFIPEVFRYPSHFDQAERESDALFQRLLSVVKHLEAYREQLPDLRELVWNRQRVRYRSLLEKTLT